MWREKSQSPDLELLPEIDKPTCHRRGKRMTENFMPVDQKNRERIMNSLDETLFVEAGAGTGQDDRPG